ncbi:MAG: LssY C-terminal domain-containing protein [Pirellulaceae bacterium]|nr:LssY C-terminal domain-containing protein [Pirellulaceae bacterium]
MFQRLWRILQRVFTIVYAPEPELRTFLMRGLTQESPLSRVTVAVLSAQESQQVFGVPMGRRGIQPVFLRIENRNTTPLRLYVLDIDPHYFTPLEAAGINHFSVLKRLSAIGIAAWYFLPLLALLPLKLYSAARANRRMDDCFRRQAFPLRPIPPGETAEGFIYATLDAGSKTVRVCLYATGGVGTEDGPADLRELDMVPHAPEVDLTFVIPVTGISADYHKRDFADLYSQGDLVNCVLPQLALRLREMPAETTNAKGLRHGDPVNLIVIGEFETLLSAFTSRWDESETITLATCWKTAKAFLLGAEYRYSPVSPLHLFGRSQDIALQRIRRSINERLHLRLWITPLRFMEQPVWVGQISRDIGVRFTTQVWNLTTHRVDPNVDESRDYVVEDLLRAERVDAVGYVEGVGACGAEKPRHNLTGDPYFTDGKRAVIVLSKARTAPRYVAWG